VFTPWAGRSSQLATLINQRSKGKLLPRGGPPTVRSATLRSRLEAIHYAADFGSE
jgi:hypothetical protein